MSIRPLKLAAIASTAIALVMSGQAAAAGGWWHDSYWGGGLGYQFWPDRELAYTTSRPKKGWIGKLELGGKIGHYWRSELELNRWGNDTAQKAIGQPGFANSQNGDYSVTGLTWNFILDLVPGGRFSPFINAGAGPAFWTAQGNNSISGWSVDDSGWAWEGHLGAGLAWNFRHGGAFDVEYRFSALRNPKIQTALGKKKEDFSNGALMAALRFPIGHAVSPPPPPPPPPAASYTDLGPYKIYFPYNKYNLTKEALAAVKEIAAQVKGKKIQRVHIEGDTDTSGSDSYNQQLSDKRSAAVREALIAEGVPADKIDTVGLGESNPAVKTGDNVKEPLNRRAEVTIRVLNN